MKKQLSIIGILLAALLFLSIPTKSDQAFAADSNTRATTKLVHGVHTTYQKRNVQTNQWENFMSLYESKTLDSSYRSTEPYPGLGLRNFKIIKTAYISITETGYYSFKTSGNLGMTLMINDSPNYGTPIYLNAGQVAKIKFESWDSGQIIDPTSGLYSHIQWITPSMRPTTNYASIPLEKLYTTPDLQGVEVETPEKLVNGVHSVYQKRNTQSGQWDNFVSVYEAKTLDSSYRLTEPYPNLGYRNFKIIKTAYIPITESGTYSFSMTGNLGYNLMVNDLPNYGTPLYLNAGQVAKVKYEVWDIGQINDPTFGLYSHIKWITPSMRPTTTPVFIPLEKLYTTPDLQGVAL
ncbi:hypothetical protein BFC22_01775 [Carnobacterium divergens]|uniref:hypothetical protein n=1 Tax=Carnobacterium divergens TaxID=2748 RepID=UPI000E70B561|nr:hypothetical protein [Carnobacterium divergens]ANZ98902.1 hypothetical protein BFC22_01775 [Carnobacterium divergens]